jgi:hypothetical protein
MASQPLRFRAELRPQRRGWLGVALPRASVAVLGSRGQVRVTTTIRDLSFVTTAFPAGDGSHFLPLNASLRQRLGLVEGEVVEVAVKIAPSRLPAPMPDELQEELSRSEDARVAWEGLTAGAKQIAARWIGGAKSHEVREFRSRDVVRRALRHHAGEGPFYPTTADQERLSPSAGAAKRSQPST